jgi:type IV pilus assembly protein PilV
LVKRRRNQGGFTLVEILIALALATLGLLGLLALQVVTVRGNVTSRQFGEALSVAQQQLETTSYTPYASLSSLAGGPTPVSVPGTTNTYNRTTTVTVGASTTDIAVTVQWNDSQDGRSHQLVMRTRESL